jgi:hypothetical protein
MITKITFGECLKFLLSTLNIRMSHLSKSINVDSSLVNHWVHGKRIPPYGSTYIDNIAEYLSKNIYNSYQIQILDDFFVNLYGSNPMPKNNKERIYESLLEAQGYSKECKETEVKHKKHEIKQHANKMKPLDKGNGSNKSPTMNPDISPINNSPLSDSKEFTANMVHGMENIFNAGFSLLKEAEKEESRINNIIYISYTSYYNSMHLQDSMLVLLRNELYSLIENNWKVVFLLRIDQNMDRVIKFIHYVLPLLKTGKVYLYYLNNYNMLTDRETYVVTQVGALSCFPTTLDSVINCGIYFKEKEAVNVYANYFNVLLTKHGKSLLKCYPDNLKEKYYEAILKAKEKIGQQFNYNCSFSMEIMTEKLYKKLVLQCGLSITDTLKSIDFHKRQLHAILSNMQSEIFYNVYFADEMESIFHSRSLYVYTYSGIKEIKIDNQDLIEFYENIIYFINTYENYQIAVINPSNENNSHFISNDIKIIIKNRKAVILHSFEPSKASIEIRLSIEEPIIIKAFMEYFNDLWDHISPIDKDKEEITSLLQSYIKILRCQAP